jgi:hypothetical protein
MSLLDDEQKDKLSKLIIKMEQAIHNFITKINEALNGFKWAENIWNNLPLEKKNEILYDIDVSTEKEFDSNGTFIKV